ncbi:hypothetical protein ACFQY9_12105 [Microvirga aerilata]|uniref:hypothetical protein n=1 Tax=Microvirga aerilata TaxID=670292 RepID=UPI00363B7AB8
MATLSTNETVPNPSLVNQAELQNPEHGFPENFGAGPLGRLLFWIAVSFSTFQIITSFGIPLDRPLIAGLTLAHFFATALVVWGAWLALAFSRGRSAVDDAMALVAILVAFGLAIRFGGGVPSQVVRALHVGFLSLVAGAMIANHRATTPSLRAVGWVIGLVGFVVGLYHWGLYYELVNRAGELTLVDRVIGIAALAVLFSLSGKSWASPFPLLPGFFFFTVCLVTCYPHHSTIAGTHSIK